MIREGEKRREKEGEEEGKRWVDVDLEARAITQPLHSRIDEREVRTLIKAFDEWTEKSKIELLLMGYVELV